MGTHSFAYSQDVSPSNSAEEVWAAKKKGADSPTPRFAPCPLPDIKWIGRGASSLILDPITHFETIKRREKERKVEKLVKRLSVVGGRMGTTVIEQQQKFKKKRLSVERVLSC